MSPMEESLETANIVRKFFQPVVLQGHIGLMDTFAHFYFVTYWEKKGMIEVLPLAKHYSFLLACGLFMSIKDPNLIARLENPFGLLLKGLSFFPIDLPGTPFNRAMKAATSVKKELLVIVKQRKIDLAEGKAFPNQDVLSRILSTRDDNGNLMPEADSASKLFGLLFASNDYITCVCTSIVQYLAELPEVYQRVYQEQLNIAKSKAPGELLNWEDIQKMKYSWNVACEAMRLAPPAPGSFRKALKDFTYNGFSVPKGWKIFWSTFSTHRNPELFREPQKFDPTRFEGSGPAPYTYAPFGGGPRMCPGKEFARLEILVFMQHLVKRFRWEKLIPDEKIVFTPVPIPEKGLPIRLIPHNA